MIQTIITALIVCIAAFIVLRNTFHKSAAKKDSACGGCASECGGCAVANLKKDIDQKIER